MAILEILQYPDPRLHEPAKRVEKIDSEVRKLVEKTLEEKKNFKLEWCGAEGEAKPAADAKKE